MLNDLKLVQRKSRYCKPADFETLFIAVDASNKSAHKPISP